MSKESTVTKVQRARKVASGMKKLFKATDEMILAGKARTRDEVIDLFTSHVAALDERDRRYQAYLAAVAAERALAKQTNAVWLDLRTAVKSLRGAAQLPKLGMKPHRKPGPRTVASKLAGVQKRAAKKRQR
jgi:hypothetical protein